MIPFIAARDSKAHGPEHGELWDDSQEQLAGQLDAAIRAESAAPSEDAEVVELPAVKEGQG